MNSPAGATGFTQEFSIFPALVVQAPERTHKNPFFPFVFASALLLVYSVITTGVTLQT